MIDLLINFFLVLACIFVGCYGLLDNNMMLLLGSCWLGILFLISNHFNK